MVGIQEREVAIPFNVQCADILNEWETEREKRHMEMIVGQVMTGAFGGAPSEQSSTVDRW